MADCGQASISVAVRVRPFTIQEAAQLQRTEGGTLFLGDGSLAGLPAPKLHQRGLRSVIRIMDDRCLVFDPPEDNPVQKFSRSILPTTKKVKDQVFAFDRVFDENTTQSNVYEGTTKNLLYSVLDGYNATVLAYGATGCGKTHTITGTAQHPGIIVMTMRELFEKIEERSQEKCTELSLSYLEIYNETIRDLLVPGGSKQGLMLREDSNHAVTVAGLSSHHPKDVQEVMDMIVQGNAFRTVSPTEANATSSRSHAVLQINVAQKDRNADVEEPHTMATLSIIDLAGSERASVTKNRGERLTEGAKINKSLLALGSCINALCDRRQRAHVPYRNSKLTRLLKFSLGGNCKTVMIVCVSPSSAHFDETQNTLRYANRAKNIQTRVTRNIFNVNRHVKDFLVKIDEQMAYINELKAQLKDAEKISLAKIRKRGQKRAEFVREAEQRLQAAYDNSASDRQKHLVCLKKLVAFDRHVELLTQCMSVLNSMEQKLECESTSDGGIGEIRRLAEMSIMDIERLRERSTQRLRNISWERPIDTALTHNLRQLQGIDEADSSEGTADTVILQNKASSLKDCFYREASDEVLAQQKAVDNTITKNVFTNRTGASASISGVLDADEQKTIDQGMCVLHQTLRTVYGASSQIAELGEIAPLENTVYPPSLKGTPKRKKTLATYVKPIIPPALSSVQHEHVFASPAKPSPRGRKVPGAARKTVSFMPIRKTKSRGVRWRDNETEEGTLADFEKTPRKQDDSEEEQTILAETATPPAPELAPKITEMREESPSSTGTTEGFNSIALQPSRFQPGFLSRTGQTATAHFASTLKDPPKRSNDKVRGLPLPSTTSALRTLENDSIRSSPSQCTLYSKSSPRMNLAGLHSVDENTPLQNPSVPEFSSDSEGNLSDLQALRSALYVAKREKGRRASCLIRPLVAGARTGAMARCLSNEHPPTRASLAGPLTSSTNGISRHSRGSSERRSLSAIPSPNLLKAGQSLKRELPLRWSDSRRQSKLEALKLSPLSAGAGMRIAAVGTDVNFTA